MLANLGVEMLDQTSYEQKVAQMEGLESKNTRDQVEIHSNLGITSRDQHFLFVQYNREDLRSKFFERL